MRALAIVAVFSMAFLAVACGGGATEVPSAEQPAVGPTSPAVEATTVPEPTAEPPTEAPAAAGVTMEQYEQVKEGMTYHEVVAILGKPSRDLSPSEVMGVKTVIYEWDGATFGSNMTGIFKDGKLMSKEQFGLK